MFAADVLVAGRLRTAPPKRLALARHRPASRRVPQGVDSPTVGFFQVFDSEPGGISPLGKGAADAYRFVIGLADRQGGGMIGRATAPCLKGPAPAKGMAGCGSWAFGALVMFFSVVQTGRGPGHDFDIDFAAGRNWALRADAISTRS